MHCTRREFGRVTYWLQTLRSWRRWTHRKSTQKRLNAKEVIFPKEKGEFIFPIADGRIENLRVFWKPVNPQDCVWESHYQIIMKTILQEKENNLLQHRNLVHKFIPMPQAVKIPAAKAAEDKEWEKLEKISAWNLTEVRSKKEVIDEARTTGAKVHFASLMDICHLENAELEAKPQKYKGRAVLRGDIVKDDSGSYAVFH